VTRTYQVVSRLIRDQDGATMVEYGLMLMLVAAVCTAAIGTLGTKVEAEFTAVLTGF
jgi:pilus assembly protein Flp/PilA